MKHSGLGIASFILSIVIGVGMFILFVVAGIMEGSSPNGMDEKSPAAILLGLMIIGLIVADLVTFGLGIAGCFQQDRNKIFSILGALFSGGTILVTLGLMAIGSNL